MRPAGLLLLAACGRPPAATPAERPLAPAPAPAAEGHRPAAPPAPCDFDADGYADLVVGAPGAPQMSPRLYLYRGGAGGIAAAPAATLGWAGPDPIHPAAACAGDIDRDGFADLVAGAPYVDDLTGALQIFPGRRGGLGPATTLRFSPAWSPEERRNRRAFGYAVAGAGDVNGDGYADVVAGAHLIERAYVFYGGPDGLREAPTVLANPARDKAFAFGWAVAGAGDVDADGHMDVLVSANQYGRVYVYRGAPDGVGVDPAQTIDPPADIEHLGERLAAAGDVNGDGYADFFVMAWLHSKTPPHLRPRVLLFFGGPSGTTGVPAATYEWSLAGRAGDVDGDGVDDVLVGVGGDLAAGAPGRAYLHLGGTVGLAAAPASELVGLDPRYFATGGALAGIGDVNGDGRDDVAVGTPDVIDIAADGKGYPGLVSVGLGTVGGNLDDRWTELVSPDGPFLHFGRVLAAAPPPGAP